VVLTADQVLHDGNVVSRSDGFGTTATRTTVSRIVSIIFFGSCSRSRLVLDNSFCENSFIRRRELQDFSVAMFYENFVFFKDFPTTTATYFINGILVTYTNSFANKTQTTHLFSANFNL